MLVTTVPYILLYIPILLKFLLRNSRVYRYALYLVLFAQFNKRFQQHFFFQFIISISLLDYFITIFCVHDILYIVVFKTDVEFTCPCRSINQHLSTILTTFNYSDHNSLYVNFLKEVIRIFNQFQNYKTILHFI